MLAGVLQVGQTIRERRLANGLTQAQLALRAGSTQAALSRLERGELSPTFETVERLLEVMGERADLVVNRLPADYDRARLAALRAREPAERLTLALSWNRLAGEIARAGDRARRRARPHVRAHGFMTRREIPLDASAILRVLSEQGVEYVVIGGVAVQAHGHPRTTQDLDLVPEPGSENLRRLVSALTALRGRPVGASLDSETLVRLPAEGVLELDTDAGGVDVHMTPPGAAPYEDLRARALELDVSGIRLAVAGRDDLIAMKRASGRPVDRGDIIALTEPDPGEG
jgi:transcriptional regulator with XRE-family HTH domain